MIALLAKITPQALGSTVSPTVFAVTMLILGSRSRPRARTAVYLAGALLVLVIVAALELLVVETAPTGVGTDRWPVKAILDMALGLGLLALGLRTALSHANKRAEAKRKDGAAQPTPVKAFILGLLMMATNFSTLILYIAAVKDVRYAHVNDLIRAGAVVYLIIFAALPISVPLVGSLVAPDATQRKLAPLNDWAKTHSKQIGVAICVVFGVYLLVKGSAAF